jgi:methylase of polypeptide subunit release factors
MLQNRLPHTPLLWEIGYDQEEDIRRLAEEAGLSLRILRDLGGNVRVAHLFDP